MGIFELLFMSGCHAEPIKLDTGCCKTLDLVKEKVLVPKRMYKNILIAIR